MLSTKSRFENLSCKFVRVRANTIAKTLTSSSLVGSNKKCTWYFCILGCQDLFCSLFIRRRQTIKEDKMEEKRWAISLHVWSTPSTGGILVEACWPTRFETAPKNVRRLFPSIAIFRQGEVGDWSQDGKSICLFAVSAWWVVFRYQVFYWYVCCITLLCCLEMPRCYQWMWWIGSKISNNIGQCKQSCEGIWNDNTQGCIWNCVSVIDEYHLQI